MTQTYDQFNETQIFSIVEY